MPRIQRQRRDSRASAAIHVSESLDPRQRAQAEQRTGCTTGTLTSAGYHDLLTRAGFTGISITTTHEAGARDSRRLVPQRHC
jgi:hypothetical protein